MKPEVQTRILKYIDENFAEKVNQIIFQGNNCAWVEFFGGGGATVTLLPSGALVVRERMEDC